MNKYAIVLVSECAEDVEVMISEARCMSEAFLNLFPEEEENIRFIQFIEDECEFLRELKNYYADFGWMVDIKQIN